ncbi:hypothetical protein [Nonomuraea sp. NPDC049625]|uniref:hypothetical protein n=1 Tax=Nonomuraea sp. NPDC049625 TaxID=3155775 RepID=UPI0034329CFE
MAGSSASGVEVSRDGSTAEASISGASQDVLLWLWGRGDGAGLTFDGDPDLVKRLRDLLKEATQQVRPGSRNGQDGTGRSGVAWR